MTDQVRRSSRSVSANIAEAWRKRRSAKAFCHALNIAEGEAAETQVWLEYATHHGYIDPQTAQKAIEFYDEIIRLLVKLINEPDAWCNLKANQTTVKEQTTPFSIEPNATPQTTW